MIIDLFAKNRIERGESNQQNDTQITTNGLPTIGGHFVWLRWNEVVEDLDKFLFDEILAVESTDSHETRSGFGDYTDQGRSFNAGNTFKLRSRWQINTIDGEKIEENGNHYDHDERDHGQNEYHNSQEL